MYIGHPTYGLTVVLSTLLIASGGGSWLSNRIDANRILSVGVPLLALLAAVVVGTAISGSLAFEALGAATVPGRIAIAIAITAPLGLLMGIALPVGMRLAAARSESVTSWLWCINGATSVVGSVAAMALALAFGITVLFWIAASAYAMAAVALALTGIRLSPQR
jgi:hypothetical protein